MADEPAPNGTTPTSPSNAVTQEQIDNDWKIYEDHRKQLLEAQLDSVKTLENWLLGLSGGAVTLSITFVKELVGGTDNVRHPAFLFWAWVMFGATCGCIMLVKFFSYYGHKTCIKYLDAEFRKHDNTVWERYDGKFDTVKSVWLIYVFRFLAMALFLAGVVILAFFIYSNLGTKSAMGAKTQAPHVNTQILSTPATRMPPPPLPPKP